MKVNDRRIFYLVGEYCEVIRGQILNTFLLVYCYHNHKYY